MKEFERRHFRSLMNGMRYQQAIRYCRSLLKQNKDSETLSRLALAYDQAATVARVKGRGHARLVKQAEEKIDRALELSAEPEYFHIRGIIRLHAEKSALALKDFQHAYHETRDARYLVSIGNALRRLNRKTEALRSYRKAQKSRGFSRGILDYNIAQVLMEMERFDEAKRVIENGLSTKPKTKFQKAVRKQLIALQTNLDL